MKEKLKKLKENLKQWNTSVFGIIEENIDGLRREIQELDVVDDVFGLDEDEMVRRKRATVELFKSLNQKHSLAAQKARLKWIKEGDLNTGYFHRAVNQRRKMNEIVGIQLGENWIEDVEAVKIGVRDFFKQHYSRQNFIRPSLPQNLARKKVSDGDNAMLGAPFSEEEVRSAIWECEGSKSPGPDGFNLKFFRKVGRL